jgi:hypothetical protein
MTTQTAQPTQSKAVPQAPSTLERWFPIATWLPKYNWGKNLRLDLIAAVVAVAEAVKEVACVNGQPVLTRIAQKKGEDREQYVSGISRKLNHNQGCGRWLVTGRCRRSNLRLCPGGLAAAICTR